MKYFFLLAASAIILASCNSNKPGYTIKGTVANPALDGKYVYLCNLNSANSSPMDSVLVKNGKFTFKGTQETPLLTLIQFNKKDLFPTGKDLRDYGPGENQMFSTLLVLENAPLTVKLDTVSNISGTPENNSLQNFVNGIDDLRKKAAYLDDKIAVFRSLSKEEQQQIRDEYDGFMDQRSELAKQYIQNNSDKLSGAYIYWSFRRFLSEEDQMALLDQTGPTFKSAPGIEAIIKHFDVVKSVSAGKPFKDFTMNDTKDQPRKLSDYVGKGNYVLVDFWASWCPPCRAEMPHLVELYKKYHKKGFEIVGVSLDDKKENWEKGIKDLNITWPQFSDLRGWKNAAAALYGVNNIPSTFLIDPQGVIVARNLRGDSLEKKIEEIYK